MERQNEAKMKQARRLANLIGGISGGEAQVKEEEKYIIIKNQAIFIVLTDETTATISFNKYLPSSNVGMYVAVIDDLIKDINFCNDFIINEIGEPAFLNEAQVSFNDFFDEYGFVRKEQK